MEKFAGLFVLFLLVVVPVVAQDAPPQDSSAQSSSSSSSQTTPDENQKAEKKVSTLFSPKYEISAGYSHRSFYTTGLPKVGMNGWYGSFTYNWKWRLAAEAEVQGVYKTIPVTEGGTENPSLYTILAGPRIYPFKHHKLSPFGHFLYGEGYYRLMIGPYGGFGSSTTTYFSHAWEGGGGLDYHFKSHWSVRGMLDYGNTHFHSGSSSGTTGQGSYRFAAGIVYYIGER